MWPAIGLTLRRIFPTSICPGRAQLMTRAAARRPAWRLALRPAREHRMYRLEQIPAMAVFVFRLIEPARTIPDLSLRLPLFDIARAFIVIRMSKETGAATVK
ncbi:hypothetical protein GCT13_01620 [Paraburkholderia sp. CNPSo 3157]|uniref:Uncharacterized protein n=1 Tax=Paraburkholderia franconis TaxID=2654983 RepID=A0A7X1TDX3_9BURK|nr:hypothetical protein [Paraburkholderia franconis]MPW15642.1 hypothetical protein [Paraburkholderia franconis]